jgi:hypothetical protein
MSEDPREALREALAALGPELADEPAESADLTDTHTTMRWCRMSRGLDRSALAAPRVFDGHTHAVEFRVIR